MIKNLVVYPCRWGLQEAIISHKDSNQSTSAPECSLSCFFQWSNFWFSTGIFFGWSKDPHDMAFTKGFGMVWYGIQEQCWCNTAMWTLYRVIQRSEQPSSLMFIVVYQGHHLQKIEKDYSGVLNWVWFDHLPSKRFTSDMGLASPKLPANQGGSQHRHGWLHDLQRVPWRFTGWAL